MGNLVDLGNLADKHKLEATISREELPDERASRLRREEADAKIERNIRFHTFLAFLLAMFGIAGFSIYVLTADGYTDADRRWASAILTGLLTGAVGYITGQKTAGKK